jgi:hypothetical protein
MSKAEPFSNKYKVLRGMSDVAIVDSDGEIDLGRGYNFQPPTNSAQFDKLTEVHNERQVDVRTILISESFTFGYALRDITEEARTRLVADGAAPTLDTAYRFRRWAKAGYLLKNDRDSGLPEMYRLRTTALPQAHNATVFPPVSSLTAEADVTAGTFDSSSDYYIWVVPVYLDQDVKHGVAAANFTLANIGNYNRGEHYICGTPLQFTDTSASPENSVQSGNSIRAQFSEPTIAAGIMTPTHFFTVIGTVEDITNAGSYIAAVDAWSGSSHDQTISAPGTVAFGTTPALADLVRVETGVVTSETRDWSSGVQTENTDYTVDRVNDTIVRIEGGGISAHELVRVNVWYMANPSSTTTQGGSGSAERYEHLRFTRLRADDTDPDNRRVEGEIVDMPRVNTAAMTKMLTSSDKEGTFHDPIPFSNVLAEVDPVLGYACSVTYFSGENAQAVDWASDDITPQNG